MICDVLNIPDESDEKRGLVKRQLQALRRRGLAETNQRGDQWVWRLTEKGRF